MAKSLIRAPMSTALLPLSSLTVPSMHLLSLEAPTQPKSVRMKTRQEMTMRMMAPVRHTGKSALMTSRKLAKEGLSMSTQMDAPIVTMLRICGLQKLEVLRFHFYWIQIWIRIAKRLKIRLRIRIQGWNRKFVTPLAKPRL